MQKSQYLRIFLVLCISISLSSCSQYLKSNAKSKPTIKHNVLPKHHRVRKGETLFSIAWYYGYDYRQIALWNDIDYPYIIKPNQSIKLYPSLVRQASQNTNVSHSKRATSSNKPSSQKHGTSVKRAKRTVPKRYSRAQKAQPDTALRKRVDRSKNTSRIKWRWPVRGKIVHRFSSKSGKKGLGIAGRKGQRIVAAAPGRVVYSGSGLRGYGKLIIIKHNDTYLSAYAHNQKILVKEQQKVKFGEHIADMGSNGANKTMLHFEIRKNGKPVNPVRYLPR